MRRMTVLWLIEALLAGIGLCVVMIGCLLVVGPWLVRR
jgi:hypothetical protein